MKITLAFPPHASPTYAPLGIASLTAFVRKNIPFCQVSACDVNITAWERAAETVAGGVDCIRFMRGLEGNFYDKNQYIIHQAAWMGIEGFFARRCSTAKRFLDKNEADPEFLALLDELAGEIMSNKPEIVGFSLLSLSQLPWALALARRIREQFSPATRIFLGGAACAAVHAEEILANCLYIDGVVVGEGEPAIEKLCLGAPDADVPGLYFRNQNENSIGHNPPPRTVSLKGLPSPDFSDLQLSRYLNPAPTLPVLFSRGCKWRRCKFCAHNFSFAGYRAKAAEACVNELDEMTRLYGAFHFYFADLYINSADLNALAEEILRRGLRINFHVLGRPTIDHNKSLLEKLFAAGCRWISWGVESGSQRLLDIAGKGTIAENVEQVLADSKEAGISNLAMMIYGLPTSSDDDFKQTMDFNERIYESVDAMTASAFVLFETTSFAKNVSLFGMSLMGKDEEVKIDGKPIHSRRLKFREIASDGSLRPPKGPVEVGEWLRRRKWLGEVPFIEGVACEHYLLYVSREKAGSLGSPARPRKKTA